MKSTLLNLIILLFITGLLASCKKDVSKTPAELLTNGCWKVTKKEQKFENTDYQDITDYLDACDLDNCLTYTSDGKFTENEGETKCSAEDPDLVTEGTWTLSADNKTLSIVADGVSKDYNVEVLTEDMLVVERTFDLFGDLSSSRITYSH